MMRSPFRAVLGSDALRVVVPLLGLTLVCD